MVRSISSFCLMSCSLAHVFRRVFQLPNISCFSSCPIVANFQFNAIVVREYTLRFLSSQIKRNWLYGLPWGRFHVHLKSMWILWLLGVILVSCNWLVSTASVSTSMNYPRVAFNPPSVTVDLSILLFFSSSCG